MKNNKKICMYSIDSVIGEKSGGVKRFYELTKYLISEGYEVILISKDSQEEMSKMDIKGKSLKITSDKMSGYNVIKKNKEIFKYIKNNNFDRVIVFDVRAALSLALYNIKNIYLFLRQDFLSYKKIQLESRKVNNIKKKIIISLMMFGEYLCLKKSKKLVVQCKYDLEQLEKRHKLIKNNIRKKTVIQINNDNPSWIVNNKLEIKNNQDNKKYDIVFVGNFNTYRKGHDILLKVLKELNEEKYLIKSAIIGDGLDFEYYKDKYKDNKEIEFLGRIKNPALIIINSKLAIVPSYADSCPNTVLEALYLNIPVIGSNRGGIPEILNNEDWTFELNENAMKKAIKKYLEDDYNNKLKIEQETRKKELEFDWSEKIRNIIEE